MRALVQRVQSGAVTISGKEVGSINHGLVVLLGICGSDDEQAAAWLAKKTSNLRVFEDAAGKMNLSVKDVQGSILVISQFTLYADCSRGNRPGFDRAAPPEQANLLYESYLQQLEQYDIPISSGVFQEHMLVQINNDGPATFLLESP